MSAGDPIRVALVGYGLGGEAFHAPLIAAEPGLTLASIVTANEDRVARARARYPDARVLPGVDALWASAGDHDLVVVTTPNRAHVPLALAALDAGLHVVVDKPLAASADDARPAIARAADRGLVCTVFQNRRLDGDFLTVRRLIEGGALGPVTRFESRFERWNPTLARDAWRERGEPEEGGGLLLDLGSHLADQAIRLFGRPTHVYAELGRRRPGAVVDDDAFVALHHESGTISHLWMSSIAGALGPRFRVLGLSGGFEKHGLDPQESQLASGVTPDDEAYGTEPPERWGVLARGEARTPVPTERGAYPAFYAGVVAAIRAGAPPPVSGTDALELLEILDSARASATSGAVVPTG
ncbi:MAG: Gfo/Idh/MocA family oxidoreductase [Actinomycetota bacterium]